MPKTKDKAEDVSWVLSALHRMDSQGRLPNRRADGGADGAKTPKQFRDKQKYRQWKARNEANRVDDAAPVSGRQKTHKTKTVVSSATEIDKTDLYTIDGKNFFKTRARMAAWFVAKSKAEAAAQKDEAARKAQDEIRRRIRTRLAQKAISEAAQHGPTTAVDDKDDHEDDHWWIGAVKNMELSELQSLCKELGGKGLYCLSFPEDVGVNALCKKVVHYLHPTNDFAKMPSTKKEPSQVIDDGDKPIRVLDHAGPNEQQPLPGSVPEATPSREEVDMACYPFTDISQEFVRRNAALSYTWQRVMREAHIAERKQLLRQRIALEKLKMQQKMALAEVIDARREIYDEKLAKWSIKAVAYRERMGMEENEDIGNAVGPKPQDPDVVYGGDPAFGINDAGLDEEVTRLRTAAKEIRLHLAGRPPLDVDEVEYFTMALIIQTLQALCQRGNLKSLRWSTFAGVDGSSETSLSKPDFIFVDLFCLHPGFHIAAPLLHSVIDSCIGLTFDEMSVEVFSQARKSFSRNLKNGVIRFEGANHRQPSCRFIKAEAADRTISLLAAPRGTAAIKSKAVKIADILLLCEWTAPSDFGNSLTDLAAQLKSDAVLVVLSRNRNTPSDTLTKTKLELSTGSSVTIANLITTTGAEYFKLIEQTQWTVGGTAVSASFFQSRTTRNRNNNDDEEPDDNNTEDVEGFDTDDEVGQSLCNFNTCQRSR